MPPRAPRAEAPGPRAAGRPVAKSIDRSWGARVAPRGPNIINIGPRVPFGQQRSGFNTAGL